jgi:hypothetical protein
MWLHDELNRTPLKQYNLICTATNWTTNYAVGIPYQVVNGQWRLRFNIKGIVSGGTAALVLTVSGVTFGHPNGDYQAISFSTGGGSGSMFYGYASYNASTLEAGQTVAQSGWTLSGDVELLSKPSFVE